MSEAVEVLSQEQIDSLVAENAKLRAAPTNHYPPQIYMAGAELPLTDCFS